MGESGVDRGVRRLFALLRRLLYNKLNLLSCIQIEYYKLIEHVNVVVFLRYYCGSGIYLYFIWTH